jgi:hypothetical protein
MSALLTLLSFIAAGLILAAWFPDLTGTVHSAYTQAKAVIVPVAAVGGAYILLGTGWWSAYLVGGAVALLLAFSLSHGDTPVSPYLP